MLLEFKRTQVVRIEGSTSPLGSAIVPSVTALRMDSGMAWLAEGDQILSCVGAAFRQRFDVVNLHRFDIAAFLQAQFAQRIIGGIAVANAFPCSTVPALGFRVAVIFFISLGFQLGVFLTKPAVCQLGAAWVGAGALWLSWHLFTSIQA